jgi:hypothetical protein
MTRVPTLPAGRTGYQVGKVWVLFQDGPLETPCEVWQGATCLRGYPCKGDGAGKLVRGHREAYERRYGPIPAGHDVHHRCLNTACLNAEHMVALSDLEHAKEHRTFDYDEAVELWRSGLSYREVGQALGVTGKAVSAAFARMRKRGEL